MTQSGSRRRRGRDILTRIVCVTSPSSLFTTSLRALTAFTTKLTCLTPVTTIGPNAGRPLMSVTATTRQVGTVLSPGRKYVLRSYYLPHRLKSYQPVPSTLLNGVGLQPIPRALSNGLGPHPGFEDVIERVRTSPTSQDWRSILRRVVEVRSENSLLASLLDDFPGSIKGRMSCARLYV
jgi:hypothetical protein